MTKTKIIKTLILLLALPFLVTGAQKVIKLRQKAAGTYANILVNTKKTIGPVPSSLWQNLAQGGEEPKDMIAPVLAQTQALQPQYIRIDHIFDYYQVYKGIGNFDFSQLDKVINTILAANAKPMLSLSYTPAIMTKNGKNASEPQDWDQWYQMVKATAHRYSVQKNISHIYYEVWNEPDLFGSWHWRKSPSYITLYATSAQAVAAGAATSTYKIGGPATTAFYKNWITALLKTCQENNLRLDFISFHRYSAKITDFTQDITQLNKLLKNYPRYQNIQKIISEYGISSDSTADYDTTVSAIHLLSLSTALSGQVNKLFTFEIVDGPTPRSALSTGWGILTHPKNSGQAKPRYHAIQFINRIKGQQLLSDGNGSWVSSLSAKNNQTIQTLLVNYDPKAEHNETVPLTFQTLTPGRYQLKISYFLGKTTSQNIHIPFTHHTEFVKLPVNSAAIIELTPLN